MSQVRALHTGSLPLFCLGTPLCLHLVGLVQFHACEVLYRWSEGIKPPSHQWLESFKCWVGVFCIKVDDDPSSKSLKQWGVHPFHTQVVLLPHSSSVSSCGVCPVCYPLASMGWCLSLHQTHMSLLAILSRKTSMTATHCLIFTHLQWMLWLMSMGEAIVSCLSTPGKSS